MMMRRPLPLTAHGFTRTDLVVVLSVCALLLLTGASLLGKTQAGAHRATCTNNLRQLGVAILKFAAEHNDMPPWFTPVSEGGSGGASLVYAHMFFLSNYVDSPRLVVCPSDPEKRPAVDFSANPNGLAGMSNSAAGYVIMTELDMRTGDSPLMADRLMGGGSEIGSCPGSGFTLSSFKSNYPVKRNRIVSGYPPPFWLPQLHATALGNVLFADGRVDSCDSKGLVRAYEYNPLDSNKSGCTMIP
ncbi:MAG: DUF1559 domain-containing protein [Verrucomicrobiae bacterium]|nr:DUF1559 domain-containing protein [Verrucomicrobiae bacterium]